MSVILAAHVSRWNTSGSVPPVFPLPAGFLSSLGTGMEALLIVHVVPAQSVAHVKVYVPTVKLPTARRCAGLTQRRAAPLGDGRRLQPLPTAWCGARQSSRTPRAIARTRSGRRRRRLQQRPQRCAPKRMRAGTGTAQTERTRQRDGGGARERGRIVHGACNTEVTTARAT